MNCSNTPIVGPSDTSTHQAIESTIPPAKYRACICRRLSGTFGVLLAIKDPLGYWPIDRWDVQRVTGNELEQFLQCFDEEFWSTIPALPGALEACHLLKEAGYDLVCVSVLKETSALQATEYP